ncbi:MAG: bifunctional methylenetetrahydrofolate dehydrogenase/methenyltetrahydrofolate cyclohydrolase FolD [Arsenophonus sp.]|nr:MAG: bifunctional methylenetetrahydrofolate dehydrogenase/methenyltetrahydrofolate cyclohydrolase FolD [Arsenophonus sp.]
MKTKIIDGKKISKIIIEKIKKTVKNIISSGNRPPGLAIILIGNNKSSRIYIKNKIKTCKEIGFVSYYYNFPKIIKENKILKLINHLNQNKNIDGIIIQIPLPKKFYYKKIAEQISIKKDVDGLHPYNIGSLFQNHPNIRPCTSSAIITILKYYNIKVFGLNAVIVGASNIVGKPMILELLLKGCITTIIPQYNKNLQFYIKNADLLIVAIGKPKYIPGIWIKPGAIVIDVGINWSKNGKIYGDVCYKSALNRASWITPVPGGVGPVTVAMLMQNTLNAYQNQYNIIN